MADAACQHFYHAFHFKLKDHRCELRDGERRAHEQHVGLQVVGILQYVYHQLFFGCQNGEYRTLDTLFPCLLQRGIVFPIH